MFTITKNSILMEPVMNWSMKFMFTMHILREELFGVALLRSQEYSCFSLSKESSDSAQKEDALKTTPRLGEFVFFCAHCSYFCFTEY